MVNISQETIHQNSPNKALLCCFSLKHTQLPAEQTDTNSLLQQEYPGQILLLTDPLMINDRTSNDPMPKQKKRPDLTAL
jgi:hypothetical protein